MKVEIYVENLLVNPTMHFAGVPKSEAIEPEPNTGALEWSPTSEKRLTFAEAEQWCKDLRHCGRADWRLPTLHELQSLVDYTKVNPAVDASCLPDTKPEAYWTASPDASDPDYAWIVYFNLGLVSLSRRNGNAWVRAVRASRASQ